MPRTCVSSTRRLNTRDGRGCTRGGNVWHSIVAIWHESVVSFFSQHEGACSGELGSFTTAVKRYFVIRMTVSSGRLILVIGSFLLFIGSSDVAVSFFFKLHAAFTIHATGCLAGWLVQTIIRKKWLMVRLARIIGTGWAAGRLAWTSVTSYHSSSVTVDRRLLLVVLRRPLLCVTGSVGTLRATVAPFTWLPATVPVSILFVCNSRRYWRILSMFGKETFKTSSVNSTRMSSVLSWA